MTDAKTSYKLLLGRPWTHWIGVIPLTLNQCLKFNKGGIKTVIGDMKPFTKAESDFPDVKFYTDIDSSSLGVFNP